MKYGGTPLDEQEVTFRLDAKDGIVHVCSTWPAWSRKLTKRYGIPPKFQERDGVVTVAFWTLPIQAMSLRSPQKRPVTTPRNAPFTRQTPAKVPVGGVKTADPTLARG